MKRGEVVLKEERIKRKGGREGSKSGKERENNQKKKQDSTRSQPLTLAPAANKSFAVSNRLK
jgi:hypothetical protein